MYRSKNKSANDISGPCDLKGVGDKEIRQRVNILFSRNVPKYQAET